MSLHTEEPTVALDVRAELGEGAIWDDRAGVLYWVNIAGRTLNRFDPANGRNGSIDVGEQVTTVVPLEGEDNVIVGLENSVAVINPETGERLVTVPLEADMPENRSNDGKCGPNGHFYIGTMSTVRRTGSASLYRISPDYTVEPCFGGVTVSNGIVWSPDETKVYYIDTSSRGIDVIDYDATTGALSNRRQAIAVPPEYGKPDGMTIDTEGRLWVAMFHGACVTVWDPQSAELVSKVDIPAKNVTSVAFGGADLSTLYATTAAIGLGPDDHGRFPTTGAIFAVKTDATGRAAYRFGGSTGSQSGSRSIETGSATVQTGSATAQSGTAATQTETATETTGRDTPDSHSMEPSTEQAPGASRKPHDKSSEQSPEDAESSTEDDGAPESSAKPDPWYEAGVEIEDDEELPPLPDDE